MQTVIKIENLYKEYKLGLVGRGTLYRDLQSWWAKIRNKDDPNSVIGHDTDYDLSKKSFLALNDINLEIRKGEVLGIIGSNGAGKSTLLKILSRVTGPTRGSIKIKGKIASLLEVGTGFHTELTGRDNIYLNGTINGMTKKEISKKLNDIVAFAGVENFLDTPVKRYSSGMFVRLGFAVAAYLDPDILIVDEVLAVGDASFQKKAIKKMHSVSNEDGRTVIFVSHNMESIKKLCDRVAILNNGKIIEQGETEKMIAKYLQKNFDIRKNYKEVSWSKDQAGPGSSIVKLKTIKTKNSKNVINSLFAIDEEIIIEIQFWVLKNDFRISSYIQIYKITEDKYAHVFAAMDENNKQDWGNQKKLDIGLYSTEFIIPKNFLNEGMYDIGVIIFLPPGELEATYQVMHPKRATGAITINVENSNPKKTAQGNYPYDWDNRNVLRPIIDSKTTKL